MKTKEFIKEFKNFYLEACFGLLTEREPYTMFLVVPTIALMKDREGFGTKYMISFAWTFYQLYFSYWRGDSNA